MCSSCGRFVLLFFILLQKRFHVFFADDNQDNVIEAFNSTSRYLDDLLKIDVPYFDGMVNEMSADLTKGSFGHLSSFHVIIILKNV